MAASSTMVRSAVVAFAAIQSQKFQGRAGVDYRPLYDRAATELSAKLLETDGKAPAVDEELVCILTTVFLLAYIDLLTDRTDLAHLNIQKAHNAIQRSKKTDIGPLERRIISWIRLLDARAATAGGEGPFVNDNTGLYTPPIQARVSGSTSQRTGQGTNGSIEEIVYDLLCQPGLAFFQEVQSITGRITKIDHYRRSRGTVEDETEVMATAAEIMKDLASLYDCRPSIMDHAVAGDLGDNVIAKHLALAIIRSYRTYLANFYACYIHIHWVAHRHLPRSKMLIKATGEIKELVHRMMANGEPLPVNILWPLFLWGSEEDDPQECRWIVDTIRSLQHVVTNAANVANLLQEVQRRQLERGQRVDIRTVSMELFNSSFAIV
ncbi:hypothetical protein VTN31DRAFT_272 [Thermomyces dupontii]|uniref:uncharacterized protein n=1 Tax=Talaromyces thermophilus TaxID=28565 RepID=UPI0037442FB6